MNFTLFTANCTGNPKNCLYPNKTEITNVKDLSVAVFKDHVCAEYKNNYRNGSNFLTGNVDVMDCDNDHSDNPDDWIYPEMYEKIFPDVSYAVVPSRSNMKAKGSKSARPRHHVYFPHKMIDNTEDCVNLKNKIYTAAAFFDENALDSARFIFGCVSENIIWHEGGRTIDDFLNEKDFADFDRETENINEGSHNSTMNRIAGKIIKRYGNTEEAYQIYLKKSELCSPPLSDNELNTIWDSAVKFGKRIEKQDGYIPPEEYNKPSEWETPIPFDEYSLPVFPVDVLPKVIGDYVAALSESTQTPVDMAATAAIAVMSVCMQGKFKIRAKADWTEPVNTFVLDVMNP